MRRFLAIRGDLLYNAFHLRFEREWTKVGIMRLYRGTVEVSGMYSQANISPFLAGWQPADAATPTEYRFGEVLPAFREGETARPLAIWARDRIRRLYWQKELKLWV